MYHTIVYNDTAAAAGGANVDLTAATDTILQQRNGHLVLTKPFRVGKVMPVGASIVRGRFQCPTFNGIGQADIFTANRSATVPSNPQYDDWMATPLPIPLNEEFQIQLTNNLASGTEVESVILQLLSSDWSPQLPVGQLPILVEATCTVTPTADAWSGAQAITLVSNLRNGVYSVQGMVCQGSNSLACRLIFPTQKPYMGSFLRPGGPVQNAIGDVLCNQRSPWMTDLGEMGRFHTLELPSVEFYGLTASSTTYRLFLLCQYLGTDLSLLTSWAASGSMQTGI